MTFPCDECGFDDQLDVESALRLVAGAPERYATLLAGRDGTRRPSPDVWSPSEYTCHVADNTRIWAQRVWQAGAEPGSKVAAPYDQDALAAACRYDLVPQATALWSLAQSVATWQAALVDADLGAEVTHPEYGPLDVATIVRRVAHEVHHHEIDIRHGLGLTGDPRR